MNWYKVAIEGRAVPIHALYHFTSEQFGAMTREEKVALARNPSISPETQRLFFTEEYAGKRGDMYGALWSLALNPSMIPEVQRLFFTEEYENKGYALESLALRKSIAPEVQRLFFTEKYEKKGAVLWHLASNPSLTSEVQRLFLTEKYEEKDNALSWLAKNEKFLRDFTRDELLQIKKVARGNPKLYVLKKRLEQLAGVP